MTKRKKKKWLKREFGDAVYHLVPDSLGNFNWLDMTPLPDDENCWDGGTCITTARLK